MPAPPASQFTDVAAIYDQLMGNVPYRRWVDYVERLWDWFGWRPIRVLDLACGTGNVAAELRTRGYDVAGIDNSAPMIEHAREKLGPHVPLYVQDAAAMTLDGEFDACVSLFDSLNYLLTWEQLRDACAGVCRALRPGGSFIFDVNSVRALQDDLFDQRCGNDAAPLAYNWESAWDQAARLCTIEMDFRVRRNGAVHSFHETHVQRGYSLEELTAALQDGGLWRLAAYEAYTFRPAAESNDRFFIVAARPLG